MTRVAVLVSGRGSNLQALIDAGKVGALGAELALVVSNVAGAGGLHRAEAAGLRAVVVSHNGRSREELDAELLRVLSESDIDLVCLAGFMRRLGAEFVRAHAGRILNVHPSLLPAFPGLHAQRQAWEHGAKVSGATVHLVDEGLDSGPILAQEAVRVLPDDSVETLSARILEAEHRLYPAVVRRFATGGYRLEGRRALEVDS